MLYPEKNQAALTTALSTLSAEHYVVVCYCAAWCRTCAGFEAAFAQLPSQYPQHSFVWVDIEEHEELLVDDDLEDFPTLLIQNNKGTVFYGPLPPFVEHVQRALDYAATSTTQTQLPLFADLFRATT